MYTWKTGKLRWRPLSFWAFQSTSWSLLLPCHHDWNHNTWRHMLLASNCTELLDNYATMASPFTSLNLSFLFYNMQIKIVLASPPHSSTLAWKIPWMEEPSGLQSMGSLRVAHDWATSLSLFIFMHWRRKWQPTPVFLPGESQGWGNLVGCRLWGHTESNTTEVT